MISVKASHSLLELGADLPRMDDQARSEKFTGDITVNLRYVRGDLNSLRTEVVAQSERERMKQA